jgi:hypothetical protein
VVATVIDPDAAVGHAVDDMIIAGFRHFAGHEIGNEEMLLATLTLSSAIERAIEARTMPAALNRGCVQAAPAGDRGGSAVMAEGAVITEPAFPPGGVFLDA